MDQNTFDDLTRRSALKKIGIGALVLGAMGIGARSAGAEATLDCNSKEKCEAKCGVGEAAECCGGKCVTECAPRFSRGRNCTCVKRSRSGALIVRKPNFCGA